MSNEVEKSLLDAKYLQLKTALSPEQWQIFLELEQMWYIEQVV